LQEVKLEPAERKDYDADGYKIQDTGDVIRRLAVIRTADGKLMRYGFKTKQDAAHYIELCGNLGDEAIRRRGLPTCG
jgi:hypothetical protein